MHKPFESWTKDGEARARLFVKRLGFVRAKALAQRMANESTIGTVSHYLWADMLRYLRLFASIGPL